MKVNKFSTHRMSDAGKNHECQLQLPLQQHQQLLGGGFTNNEDTFDARWQLGGGHSSYYFVMRPCGNI